MAEHNIRAARIKIRPAPLFLLGWRGYYRLGERLVRVAPAPVLAGLEGGDYRIARKARPVLSSTSDLWEPLDAKGAAEGSGG